MHQEEVNIADVVDEESLVAGGHHVAGFLVRSETNLIIQSALSSILQIRRSWQNQYFAFQLEIDAAMASIVLPTYRWHNHLALETSSDTIVNTLRLSPAGVETFVSVCMIRSQPTQVSFEDRRIKTRLTDDDESALCL